MAALVLPAAALAQTTAGDRALLDMREAARRGDLPRLQALLPATRGHVLEPLAVYWDARARLASAPATDTRAALDRLAGTYWEDRLRADWLAQLGLARDWTTFADQWPRYRMGDERALRCYAALADTAAGRLAPEAAAERVAADWLAQREADDGCSTAARSLLEQGALKPATAWLRARLAIESGRTPVAAQAVGLLNPDWAPMVETIAANPARYLDEKVTAIRPRTKELVTLAIIRLAASDPAAAAAELDHLRWRTQLTAEERSWAWGAIGKRAAQRLMPEAGEWFARADPRHLGDDHLAWKVRAALRAQDWATVRDTIAAMRPAQAADPTWVYWRARAVASLQQPDAATAVAQARALYESIASPHGFYEQLALEALGQPVTTPPAPAPLTREEIAAAERDPGLQRALAAIRLGLRTEGVREWNYTVALHTPGGLGERELLAAADLACRQQLWDRCINTSLRTRQQIDVAQRFPLPYRDAVLERTRAIGLDPAYVYGLIRQESRFIADARSGVGAAGLMQVMPATARWTARKIGLSDFRPQQITERDTNIQIGTAYLKFALDDFEGSLPLAAAAYNAGPSRARQWRQGATLPGEIWAETIPFEETRDYVKRVLANTTQYAALITGRPQSLRERLGTVGPRADSAPSIDRDLP